VDDVPSQKAAMEY